jgi:hypothetical protein
MNLGAHLVETLPKFRELGHGEATIIDDQEKRRSLDPGDVFGRDELLLGTHERGPF